MSEKCVHEWYYRIVDICSWQFFCIRCGEKLSMDKFSDHASDLEKRMAELGKATARIAELEAENDRLQSGWFRDETICPDGSLRPKVSDLLNRIAELEAAQRWIPVSERMPDNWKSVLTIDISKSTRDMVTAFYNPETSLWSTHFSCDLWVTHWMPLPEPPIVYGKVCEE